MYVLFDRDSLKKENFKLIREAESGKKFLGLSGYEWGTIIFVFFLIMCISIIVVKFVNDDELSFWGSIIGGLVSGFLTLFGVVIAFKLESERRYKIQFKKICDYFSYYLDGTSEVFDTLQAIYIYISDESLRTEERYNKILSQIENCNLYQISKTFEAEQLKLEGISRTMFQGLSIYFLEISKYWGVIVDDFKQIKINKKKEYELNNYLQHNYPNIQLATHTLLASVWYANNDGDAV
jgi:hypothetical protein